MASKATVSTPLFRSPRASSSAAVLFSGRALHLQCRASLRCYPLATLLCTISQLPAFAATTVVVPKANLSSPFASSISLLQIQAPKVSIEELIEKMEKLEIEVAPKNSNTEDDFGDDSD
ncbi:hypothetical protein PIB30_095609 [Stylosanthes scabra]|uniref:Uncharacterized protein n=1 Tax=Stylosanthes scabra TaxID=79078 RepID=A0ABU6UV88_9FABA|nr:hypothetical protein [Stylosanthes scabra]